MRSTPPEFAASQMVKVAETLIKDDKDWQREVLEEAFEIARLAKVHFKLTAPTGAQMLGRHHLVHDIGELEMDRLSLQCRALQVLVEVDPQRALELVTEVAPLEIPQTDCAEPYPPSVDVFYQMLLTLARQAFSAKEQAKNLDLDFVEPFLQQVNHPVQVTPASRLVRFLGTSPERVDRLLNVFLAALDDVRNDDRAFSGSNNSRPAAELLMLGTFASQHGARGPEVFARLRSYFISHLSGPRCSDNVLSATGKPAPTPAVVQEFNQLIEHDPHRTAPITEDEIKPLSHAGQAVMAEFWQTPTAANLKRRFYSLVMGEVRPSQPENADGPKFALVTPDRSSAVWHQAIREFLQDVRAWLPGAEETLADWGHQKCFLYVRAYQYGGYVPDPRQFQDDLEFLLAIRDDFTTFPEWYIHANLVLSRNRPAIYPGKPQFQEPFQDVLRNTRDSFFQVVAKLDAAFARK